MSVFTKTYAPALAALGLAVGIGLTGQAESPTAWGVLCALCVGAVGALGWCLQSERRRADRAAAEIARLEALLAAAPQPWFGWDGTGGHRAAPEFVSLLHGATPESGEDIAALLAPADAGTFADALQRLRADGRPFRLDVTATDGRRLRLTGRRGHAADGGALHDVLWLEDVSDACQSAEQAKTDRAAAETAAAELRTALDALPLPVWLRRADLGLAWCNGAYARAVDADPDRAVAEGRELAPGGAVRELASRARTGGFAQSEKLPVVVGTQRRLLEVTEAPLPGPGGGTLMLGYALDVTPLEDLRTELDRHLAAHAEVLERLGSAIAVFGPDQRLKFFNQAYVRLWDMDEAFLRSEPTHGELMEELRSRRKLPEYADFQSYKRERLTRYTRLMEATEELMHLPDGTTLRSLAAPHPLGGIITIMEDVTNTLALESSYNTLIAVQQETLDNLAEGIAVFGGDGRLKLSNPAFARIWELRDEDLQGEPHITEVFDRMHPFFADGGDWDGLKDEMVGSTLERSVRSGRLERTDGSVIEFSTVPLPDGAVLNSYLDVTDSARLEQALRASNAALEAADQLKGEFIANVSHHLRTPLNGIIGFAEVLANEYFGTLTPRQLEYVKGILSGGERLLALIDDVVDLTSIGAGVTTLEHDSVDVADLLDSVAGLTREWARREGLRLEVSADPALGILEGDEKRLKQALFNLVVTAIRTPSANGRIVLSGRRTDDTVVLAIGDGTTAPVEDARVPARFDRLDRAAPVLGLTLVRNVIEMHGGRMEVDDTPGPGLRVRCVLPAKRQSAAA
ncbi:PAS-domain containing protein [Azospirillum sp.]|uniref:sensor histidine kinase n=1 Tax=Azospirillum sp. TaxID=34012 RepID=UPI003D710C84